jgi:hypothetical protein
MKSENFKVSNYEYVCVFLLLRHNMVRELLKYVETKVDKSNSSLILQSYESLLVENFIKLSYKIIRMSTNDVI